VFALSAGYLEIMNSGAYLRTILFDLRAIMITSPRLALLRLTEFLINANLYFFACVIYSFYVFASRKLKIKDLSIWQVSFLLHIPFLLTILGNGGGGPNYFLTMWISIVLLCIETVKKTEEDKVPLPPVILGGDKIQGRYGLTLSNALLIALIVNSYEGMITITRDLGSISLPTPSLERKMQEYYQSVATLVSGRQDMNVLTNRNVGALASTNVKITNEGSTMFNYAWNVPSVFDRNVVLSAIREKRFDLITSGLQEYPEDVKHEIDGHYHAILTKEVNLYFGNMGLITFFAPNAN
jgi:hypothetical protein